MNEKTKHNLQVFAVFVVLVIIVILIIAVRDIYYEYFNPYAY